MLVAFFLEEAVLDFVVLVDRQGHIEEVNGLRQLAVCPTYRVDLHIFVESREVFTWCGADDRVMLPKNQLVVD